jgi:hypothetical protein
MWLKMEKWDFRRFAEKSFAESGPRSTRSRFQQDKCRGDFRNGVLRDDGETTKPWHDSGKPRAAASSPKSGISCFRFSVTENAEMAVDLFCSPLLLRLVWADRWSFWLREQMSGQKASKFSSRQNETGVNSALYGNETVVCSLQALLGIQVRLSCFLLRARTVSPSI